MNTYQATKNCKNCGKGYTVPLTKYEAAFDPLSTPKVKDAKCPVCKSPEYQSASVHTPEIDEDILLTWARDSNLYLMEQDEDLLLADGAYIDLIDTFIDRDDILDSKRNILLCALCIVIYDKNDNVAYQKAKESLLSHKHLLDNARTYIWDYVGKKVYPQLGLKW